MPLDNAPITEGNHIPAAVRRAGRKADQLHADLVAPPQLEPSEPLADPPDGSTVLVDPPAAPAEPVVAPVDWEHRYRTLQGKYDAEIPSLRGELEGLRQVLSTLQTAPARAAPPEDRSAPPTTTVVDPADVETYGEELITSARRWARAELEPQIASLRTEIETLKGGQTQTKDAIAKDRTMAALDGDPDIGGRWRELNNDPEFLLWLEEIDPFAGEKRLALLQNAFGRGDAARTGKFFKAYIAEHTAVTLPAADLRQTPPAPAAAARPQLADMAAPGRAAAPSAPGGAPADRRIWTGREINAFYRDRQKGVYEGREAEALRLETDIIAAAREGRIRNE